MSSRRYFVRTTSAAAAGLAMWPACTLAAVGASGVRYEGYPAVRITDLAHSCWFGYYDKRQTDPTGRYVLGNRVEQFFRSPTPQDTLRTGMIDTQDGDRWIDLGRSSAWGWQQACMLQWVPGSATEVIWNARLEDGFVSVIHDVATGQRRILPKPIYTLSPDGAFGLGVDFARLQFFRPGYGYAVPDLAPPAKAPDDAGVYRVDLRTGHTELILSYAQVARLARPLGDVSDNYHWINHLLINPAGTRFICLNRSRPYPTVAEWDQATGQEHVGDGAYVTRALTVDVDGSDLYALNDSGEFSHFIWKGDDALCAWSRPEDDDRAAFYLYRDRSKRYEVVGAEAMPQNGHNTYVPHTDDEWILNDTYPQGEDRVQTLYLYHVPTDRKVVLGRFHEPPQFRGEWRCDLHPRCDPRGTAVFFDSTHEGDRRQMYRVDISKIIAR